MKWPTVKLGEVAEVKIGPFGSLLHKHDYMEGGVPLVNPMHIEGGRIAPDRRHAIAPEKASELAAYRISEGDVILARRGEMGRCAIVHPADDGFLCGTGSLIVRPGPSLSSEFLSLLFSSRDMVRNLERASLGTTMPNLNRTIVANIQIPLPPLPEQRRIAAILDQADALCVRRRQMIAHLTELARSIFTNMFGDFLADNRSWPSVQLSELIIKGPQNGLYKPASNYGSGTRIVRIDSFQNGSSIDFRRLKRVEVTDSEATQFGLQTRDILINRVNSIEYLGKATVVPSMTEVTVFESNMMRLTIDVNRMLPECLVAILGTKFATAQIRTAAKDAVNQSSINQNDVKGFKIPLPPIRLQQEYLGRIGCTSRVRSSCSESLRQLNALFASLQSRAFRGEL